MLKSSLKQSIALCLSLALFLSSLFAALNIHPGTAEAAATLPDNVYPVSYRYVKDGSTYDSAANMYLSVPGSGKLIVQNGKVTFEHEISPQYYGYFQFLAFRNPGAAKAVINTSTNTAQGTEGYTPFPVRPTNNGTGNMITTIQIEDITKKQDVVMHVVIKDAPEFGVGFHYDYWYNVQLEINTKGLPINGNDGGNGGEPEPQITLASLKELVTVSKSVYASTYEGTQLGDSPAGTRLPFYTKIVQTETIIASGSPSTEDIKKAYDELTAALNTFKSLIYSADKRVLASLIAAITEFRDGIKEVGYADGQVGSLTAPAGPGEFIVGPKTNITYALESAQKVYDEPKSTQTAVDDAVRILTGEYNSIKDSYYIISADPVKVIALDSLSPTTVPSANAPEIAGTTSYITLKNADLGTKANITFNTNIPITDVMQPTASGTGGYTAVEYRASQLIKSSDDQKKMYQVSIRKSNVADTKWLGQSYVRYKLDGVTKVVYLSYNADKLEALSQVAAAAQKLTDTATSAPGAEAAYAAAKTTLLSKIDAAKTTAANLASTRPQIYAADTALEQAVTTFKASAAYPLYFTTVHATSDAFSAVESYFLKPATVTTAGGATSVSFTIKDSSIIKEFQVKTGGQYVDAAVVSENTANNTRVVNFKADSLTALLDAKVHIAIPEQNYDRMHDIRLNLNNVDNSALSQAITDANTLYRTSVTGTAPGQYPQAAKTALQSAINTAGAEASRLTGTTELTAAALQSLQKAVTTFKASVIAEPSNPGSIPDGEYPIGFTIYKKGTDEKSVMYDYVDPNSGKLTVTGSKNFVSFTVKQNAEIKSFKTERNGVLTETETVSVDTAANTRVVRFEVTDIQSRLNGWVKIYWVLPAPIGVYDHEYEVELGFDFKQPTVDKSQLTAQITEAQTKLAAAVEGTVPGQYPVGSKAVLQAAITAAEAVAANASATQQAVNDAVGALKSSMEAFNASVIAEPSNPGSIPDGEYPIGFTIYKKGTDEKSVMYDYVDPNSGKLTVSGGKNYVSFTVKQNAEIKSFKTERNGVLTETETVSVDTAANTRVVRFEVADIQSRLNGWVKIYWVLPAPIGVYDHEYEVELGFDFKQPTVDKSQLTAQITEAQTKLAAAVEGSAPGQYPVGSKAVLQAAITAAEAVAANASATQQAVNDAVGALKSSISKFQASIVLADANYSFNWPSSIHNGNGTLLTSFISSDASMKVSGGKQIVTIQLLSGVTFKKLQMKKADGSLEDIAIAAAAKQSGVVTVLAASSTQATASFEIKDRSAVYVLSLLDAAQNEHAFEIDFSKINPSQVTEPGTDNGTSTRRSGGGGGAIIIKPLAETLEAGKYTIEYALYSRGTSQTSAAEPFAKHPAKLEIANGKSYVLWTVSNKEITALKIVDTSGAWIEPKVVAVNETLNERTVQFEIQNAQAKVLTQFKLAASNANNGVTEADIAFDKASIQPDKKTNENSSQPEAKAALKDLQNHWAQASIEQAIALGIVNGYEDNTFRPDANINRTEFVTLLNKALKLGQSSSELSFTDASQIPQWVKPHLTPAVQAGIVTGYEDGTFRADRQISRSELAVVIVRAMKLKVDADARSSFSDADSIPQWAQASVAAAHKQGIINGRDNNRFEPDQSATRAEAVSLILSLYNASK
ncbi:NEAT domain-containing protein [Paenibacillus sp. RC67]|uniref:NEAT domain-containing protein n=1 Tax=Paenibacillus sp. RC67 TaxID=3039392 RepID=UPI0024ADBD6D|nr:NEAT domain-containing protein [Paenibacillus sp. RC67]